MANIPFLDMYDFSLRFIVMLWLCGFWEELHENCAVGGLKCNLFQENTFLLLAKDTNSNPQFAYS